jgi:hypothetical protein
MNSETILYDSSFPIMKRLIVEQCTISEQMKKGIEEAKTCKELYDVMKRDFWVVTPCYSTASPGKVMEGTRLTLQVKKKTKLTTLNFRLKLK